MISEVLALFSPFLLMQWAFAVVGCVVFLIRGTCIAIGDFWVMYVRVGKVWKQPTAQRTPSTGTRDLVMQLAAQSPTHSRLCAMDELLHLNDALVDRHLWRGLSATSAAPSIIITGVSYGGIGFYTALHVMLCGANVHGVVRSKPKAVEAETMIQQAVERQCRLHKEWARAGQVGRIMLHTCDMSDTVAVVQLADKLISDPNIRGIVCNAGSMCTPPKLSPQNLEEQFATHHVGHSLLVLRLLQHRQTAAAAVRAKSSPHNGGRLSVRGGMCNSASTSPSRTVDPTAVAQHYGGATPPCWRIIITASVAAATADPTEMTTFHRWASVEELGWHRDRFSGYGNAKMCELLFAFALARHVRADRQLAPYCTVNVVHPGPIRSRVIPNSKLPMKWLLDGEVAAMFRMTPSVASLFVTDLCLSKRHSQVTGHFFRMGEDQTEYYATMVANPRQRRGFFTNSTLWPGIPGPQVALSERKQEWLWNATLNYFESRGLLACDAFR